MTDILIEPLDGSCDLETLARTHFNEPVLIEDRLMRLVGYAEDSRDCYFICHSLGGKPIWMTCVGGYYWLNRLKGQGYVEAYNGEKWDDFYRLDNLLALNGAPKVGQFIFEKQAE